MAATDLGIGHPPDRAGARRNLSEALLHLDRAALRATQAGQPLDLTDVEFTLLEMLMRSPGKVVEREELAEAVLGRKFNPFDRSLDMHVSRLRRKLAADPDADLDSFAAQRGERRQLLGQPDRVPHGELQDAEADLDPLGPRGDHRGGDDRLDDRATKSEVVLFPVLVTLTENCFTSKLLTLDRPFPVRSTWSRTPTWRASG